jgi:hypothetical protein
MSKKGRKPIEITEQDTLDIMLLNSQGYMPLRISEITGKPKYKITQIIKNNGGTVKRGRAPSHDNTTIKEQTIELWNNGLTNTKLIAEKLNTSRATVGAALNICGIKIRESAIENIDIDIAEYLKKAQKGENVKGWRSMLAKKYNVSRQAVSIRIKRNLNRYEKMLMLKITDV